MTTRWTRLAALPVAAFLTGLIAAPLASRLRGTPANDDNTNATSSSPSQSPSTDSQWDRLATEYDRKIDAEERRMHLELARDEFLCRGVHGQVLEVAAGTGRNLPFLLRQGAAIDRLVLVDASPRMLAHTRAKLASDSPRVDLRVADAEALPFGDAEFDFVLASFSLCSVALPLSALAEMARVVRPGGEIRLLEHGRSAWCAPLNWYLDRMAPTHLAHWGCLFNRDIDRLIADSAPHLRVVEHTTAHLGTTHKYVLKRRQC